MASAVHCANVTTHYVMLIFYARPGVARISCFSPVVLFSQKDSLLLFLVSGRARKFRVLRVYALCVGCMVLRGSANADGFFLLVSEVEITTYNDVFW